ncbi:DNA repair protein RecO [Nitrogeniibacter mangrovi]|uniref:DNA repair protein RecO n=1 Tax=Nitrogeniibacter mangrovi TaxID=2016596 RepID=A0A6C1B6A4_9RHOO|nr:DNA repair protein RecO [Nitrogeniibacter mangrovi]QID17774.1 DNA repair protein RecO [Nitrogeniibacter mangrovi]
MGQKQRVDQQPGFILHTHPYRETSLIVELFSRDLGRLALVAKGARRPMSALRGVLLAYQPLLVDWSGGGEVKTLVRAEWQGGQPMLQGRALLCGYYLNELLMRFLPREDPHPDLYASYADAVGLLPRTDRFEPLLRRFELQLLEQMGYGVPLTHEAGSDRAVAPQTDYHYIIERGPVPAGQADEGAPRISGTTLLDMAAGRFESALTLAQSKSLLRHLIGHHLGGQALQSRRMFKELQSL